MLASLRSRLQRMTISKLAIWILDATLFTLCCYIAAGLVSAWLGDLLAASRAPQAPVATLAPRAGRTWADRQAILDRNLFQVSTLLPTQLVAAPAEPADEVLRATRLPLRLLGTVASADADAAYAAVEDQQTRKQSVVRVGEGLLENATVLRIERRRIVIQNGPNREELALDDEEGLTEQATRRVARSTRPPDKPKTLPKYEMGQVTGVEVSSIDRGSLLDDLGVREGDTVTQVNGIVVTGPQDSAAALRELSDGSEFQVTVIGADGQARILSRLVGTD
jgi:type II secretory pathway component PulC